MIDPLDGTREFGEPPRDDWAVHVALCVDGQPVAGSVALPAAGPCIHNGEPVWRKRTAGLRDFCSAWSRAGPRAPLIVTEVAELLSAPALCTWAQREPKR